MYFLLACSKSPRRTNAPVQFERINESSRSFQLQAIKKMKIIKKEFRDKRNLWKFTKLIKNFELRSSRMWTGTRDGVLARVAGIADILMSFCVLIFNFFHLYLYFSSSSSSWIFNLSILFRITQLPVFFWIIFDRYEN